MSESRDLTRWNRAGKRRFEYIDGNGPLFLDQLKLDLQSQFTERWSSLPPATEIEEEASLSKEQAQFQKNNLIVKQYYDERGDIGWELVRSFSQACHVLTGHINAHSNEAYLRTATQWDNVRRLVELIDYHPSAATSASTPLILKAKKDKNGVLPKGFQVKHLPATGGKKVVFETLEDLYVDHSLNELRPKGWNQSEASPLLNEHNIESIENKITASSTESTENSYSSIMMRSAEILQNIGSQRLDDLIEFAIDEADEFKIKDLLDLNSENPPAGLVIAKTWLREFKVKAKRMSNLGLEPGWKPLEEWKISEIASELPDVLMELTGYTLQQVKALKLKIDLIETYLDQSAFYDIKLNDFYPALLTSEQDEVPFSVRTSWKEQRKPNVSPGQIAMVIDEYNDHAEAVMIDRIEDETKYIHLLTSPLQYSWKNWFRGKTRLYFSPRWKRKCWLNNKNIDVIRTEEAHGLSIDSHICWLGYELNLIKVANANELTDDGRSLVIVALVGASELHIRIFDPLGNIVVDKAEQTLSEESQDNNSKEKALTDLKEINPLPAESSLSEDDKQDIIKFATVCAGYTRWRFAKIIEVDNRDIRLKVTGALPKKGDKLIVTRPFESDQMSASYEEIVLLDKDGEEEEASIEPVSLEIPESELNEDFTTNKIFSIKTAINSVTGSGGGGLLPPASLPSIGSFLFPSPMLPMDLVKVAIDMLLNLGVMMIPSTGKFVFKGLPLGGVLGNASSLADAAKKLVELLDNLELPAQWKRIGTSSFYELVDLSGKKVYLHAVCKNGSLPSGYTLVNSFGNAVISGLKCSTSDGNVLDVNDNPVGYQPIETGHTNNQLFDLKLIEWSPEILNGPDDIQKNKENAILSLLDVGLDETILFKKIIRSGSSGSESGLVGPLLAVPKTLVVQAVVEASDPLYMFDGSPDKLESGDWVVGRFTDGLRALKINAINEFTDSDETKTFSLSFNSLDVIDAELKKVYGDFRGNLIAEDANINNTPVDPHNIELEAVPESLKIGRKVLLTGKCVGNLIAKIESIDGNTIKIDSPATGCTKGELIIRGNFVESSHGAAKPVKRLSSGDTGQQSYSLLFDVENVSSVTDPIFPSGVRADVEVVIDGLIWQHVPRLDISKPTDSHYTIRATEEGFLRFEFGGRRLPSGTNNINVSYRVGAGRSGNLKKCSLIKPVQPHPLIESVEQPAASVGGEELESVEFMRENAPGTLLALERSVSLSDFENLATSRNDVWQAKAFYHPSAGTYLDRVQVVVVPAGGGEIKNKFKKDIEDSLALHAIPTVSVRIKGFLPIEIKLKINIRVDLLSYDPIVVMTEVRSRLLEVLTLERRQISQTFYLSEVYHVVEGTKGVSDSTCVFQNNASHHIFTKSEEQVLYLGNNPDDLLIDYQGYIP